MASFEVLMPLPGMPEIAERLERRVTLHKLWEAPDREATLAKIAPVELRDLDGDPIGLVTPGTPPPAPGAGGKGGPGKGGASSKE